MVEFRAVNVATEQNKNALEYLVGHLEDREAGRKVFDGLLSDLGNVVESYPDWHPILTAPPKDPPCHHVYDLYNVPAYRGIDHTVRFVKGFVTCPYSEDRADKIVEAVTKIPELLAYRLSEPLYADTAYPVVVMANEVELEADGTICGRDALMYFIEQLARETRTASVAETWWNVRGLILGSPHGARSSLFVNQHAGAHMRKILEAINNSGVFGPIKESSLEMLSKKKRDAISETILKAALKEWGNGDENFEFEMRGEICRASVRDTWEDGEELSIRVEIGMFDLSVGGFYYRGKTKKFELHEPKGKRMLAEKFL